MLAAKLASLPEEPSTDDENAVTLLVRMPDGSRHGRRFLKSDKLQVDLMAMFYASLFLNSHACLILQSLFDFLDTGRVAKPRTYKLVAFFFICNSFFFFFARAICHDYVLVYLILPPLPPCSQVRPYPRRAFGEEEGSLSLSDLGLTSKQEALFLELI